MANPTSITRPALVIAAQKQGHVVHTTETEITIDTGEHLFRIKSTGVEDRNGKTISTDDAYAVVMEKPAE